ncbi:MAG: carbohydrate binding domain-containing protein [Archangium sp.]
MRHFAVLFFTLTACELAPLDVTGLRCDESAECGDGFVCYQARCFHEDALPSEDAGSDAGTHDAGIDAGTSDAGIDAGIPDAGFDAGIPDAGIPRDINLLLNPGFEIRLSDGGVASWRASSGRVQPSNVNRSGQRGAKLYSVGTAQQPVLFPSADIPGTEFGMLFCASAWVRAENGQTVDLTLTLRDRYSDGGSDASAGVRFTATDTWRQVKEQHLSFGNSTMQMRVSSVTRYDAGDGFFVDDTVLLRSSTSFCP